MRWRGWRRKGLSHRIRGSRSRSGEAGPDGISSSRHRACVLWTKGMPFATVWRPLLWRRERNAMDAPLLDSVAGKRMLARGKERSYLTYDELDAVLTDQVSSEQKKDTIVFLVEQGITLFESEEAARAGHVIPLRMIEAIKTVWKAYTRIKQEIGCEPTLEQLVVEIDMPLNKVRKLLEIAK